jgi:uncharacterized membrane protein
MERVLVVVFDSKEKAHEGSRVLEDLNEQSVIALYADAVLTKDLGGSTTVVKTHYADPQGTMGGTAVGSLVGMLGGPVGLAIGAAAGFVVGATADYARVRFGSDFLAGVKGKLARGKAAVVAEIDEEDTEPVNGRMAALGGTVMRQALSDVVHAEYEHKVHAVKEKLAGR